MVLAFLRFFANTTNDRLEFNQMLIKVKINLSNS